MIEEYIEGARIVRVRRLLTLALACVLPTMVRAATAFPALERPALEVRAPERQLMTSAARAGDRVVAVGERGIVVLSDDGGGTWRQARRVPVSTTLTAVAFADSMKGWSVGHGGVVLHTEDGGETWEKQADGAVLARAALDTMSQAARRHPEDERYAQAMKATQRLVEDGADKPLLDVHFADTLHGWVVGAYNLFFETDDGGKTWQGRADRLNNPKGLHLYAIRSEGRRLYIVGEQGQLHRSVDGGMTFEALSSPYKGSLFAMGFTDTAEVVIAGLRGNAFRSSDDGLTWRKIDGMAPVSIIGMWPLVDGGALLANQEGQMFVDRPGSSVKPIPVPPMQPLAGVLLLKDDSLLALGIGGVVRVPIGHDKTKEPK